MATADSRQYLTQKLVESLPATGARYKVRDCDGAGARQRGLIGFFVRVSPDAGSKSYYLDYRSTEGVRHTLKIGSASKVGCDAARAKAEQLLGQVRNFVDPATERRKHREERKAKFLQTREARTRTLASFIQREYAPRHLAHKKSGEATRQRIQAAWAPFLDSDLAALTARDIETHIARRIKQGIAPQTANRDRTALTGVLNKAVEWGVIVSAPRTKPLKTTDDSRVRYLGQHDDHEREVAQMEDRSWKGERERFMEALQECSPYMRAMTMLALHTGLRRGEIFGLTWRQIDFKRASVTVAATTTKTSKPRILPLNETAHKVLRDWKDSSGNVVQLSGLVFPSEITGGRFDNIKRQWAGMLKRAGIEDFHFHDCRHDYASRLVMAGVDLNAVRELLGHQGLAMTVRYAHLAPSHLAEAVQRIA